MPVASIIAGATALITAATTAASGAAQASATKEAGEEARHMFREKERQSRLGRMMLGQERRAEQAIARRTLDMAEEQQDYGRRERARETFQSILNSDQNLKQSFINKYVRR